MMTIHFSEKLKSLEDLKLEFGRKLSEDFLDISFISKNDGECSQLKPQLVDWFVT